VRCPSKVGRSGVTFDEATEFFVGVVGISGGEDVPDVVGDLFSHWDFGGVLHRVLSQVELAALPGDSSKGCLLGGLESFVSITDDQFHAVQPTLLQRHEELAPVNFGLGQ
jgi:hypothetical protein